MTRSIYVVGGAGTGKSTFMEALLRSIAPTEISPLLDLHTKPNARGTMVTLRGHMVTPLYNAPTGLYLGVLRESFPGSDGLDRASSPTGEEWLDTCTLPTWIIGEGATLSTQRFLAALHRNTELMLVHLRADETTRAKRFAERGSTQSPTFIKQSATRAANRLREARAAGFHTLSLDTAEDDQWDLGLDLCLSWLGFQ